MNPASHHRRSIRLPNYHYTLPGAYFVTICTWQMQCLFGEIKDAEMRLNALGRIVEAEWTRLARQFPFIELDTYVVMPNHIHGIIRITESVGATRPHPTTNLSGKRPMPKNTLAGISGSPLLAGNFNPSKPCGPSPGSLGAIVGQYKSRATKRIWSLPNFEHAPIWQRNYYEHIIRDEADWENAIAYIQSNPSRWAEDRFCS